MQPPPEIERQQPQPTGHNARKDARPLRPASDQYSENAVVVERRKILFADFDDFLADRIADKVRLVAPRGLHPFGVGIACCNRVDPAADQSINTAQHRILFMHHGRHTATFGAKQSGKCRITAETDHGRRAEFLENFVTHQPTLADRLPAGKP